MLGIKRISGAADLAPKGQPRSWVGDAAREKFMAAYQRVFALWPQPCEEFDIETATATTRVHAYRPHPDGEAVVLLSGAGSNAAGWYPHAAALAGDGPVYGIDMPGDPNPSVPRALMTPRRPAPPGSTNCSPSSATVPRTWSASHTGAGSP